MTVGRPRLQVIVCHGCRKEFERLHRASHYCPRCVEASRYGDAKPSAFKGGRPGETLADYLERRDRADWNFAEEA